MKGIARRRGIIIAEFLGEQSISPLAVMVLSNISIFNIRLSFFSEEKSGSSHQQADPAILPGKDIALRYHHVNASKSDKR
eukprot:876359-Amorphochlora_amoeboformis.AAC.2